jgi:hypothetical protein
MISDSEREFVVNHLRQNRAHLLAAVAGLTPEQRGYKPSPDCWCVADCVEHIILVETLVGKRIETLLGQPAEPEKRPEAAGKEQKLLRAVPDRINRVKGPDFVMPNGRWPEFEALIGEFEATRDRTIAMAETTQAELRDHFFNHFVFKELDCYQWLLFMSLHCERHILQIAEVKSAPGFPL